MRINHNISSYNTQRQLTINNSASGKSLEKLSSGFRINRAADDAAGLAISEKMRNQIRGLEQANKNALDGISLIQTAEGALNETHSMLQRMAELYVQGANEVLTTTDAAKIDSEVKQLSAQIGSIASQTQFNTKKLLDGTTTGVLFQVGANGGETISLTLESATATQLSVEFGSTTGLQSLGTSAAGALNSTAAGNLSLVQAAINTVSQMRSDLGAVQNRLEHTINNLGTTAENLQAAESRIRDVDMAKEMSEFTKNNILQQAATAMLAQANQQPQGVLQLLR
ncbi:flagellin N-terminal helical domain-containing protein [Paenibacillus phocaensis]|uniref:flagellin N-terminal helical domain-containing protein n=1 Tax=Paenibacillus phocaensis TaxID=1776378 RepID=UPI000839C545|nr:flagellin [Paenibacillus phocaensis]